MPSYFAQAILRSSSGQAADDQVNTFAIGQIGALNLTLATAWVARMKTFYDTLNASTALKGRTQNGHLVKIYSTTGAAPNYPLFEIPFNLAAAVGSVDIPLEVNLCVSYMNTAATTIPRARRRGRIFISGWTAVANSAGRPTTSSINLLGNAYKAYVTGTNLDLPDLDAGVWSRVNNTVYPVDTIWVDNEWDTMRSRGGRATVRTNFNLP